MKLYILTESGKTEMDLDPGQYTLGSAEDNTIQIEHHTVSSHHAVIDISQTGQTLVQSLIPSGIVDSDSGVQDMLTLFPGDHCLLGHITIGRETALPVPPPPPPGVKSFITEEPEEEIKRSWTDIFHYPFRKDAWIMMLIMIVLSVIPMLIPGFLALPAMILNMALGLLYAFTLLGTCKEIIRTTLAGDDDLEMPIADSFDWESSKEIFLGYFLLSIVWLGPFIVLNFNWIPIEQVWVKPLALALGLSILPMALLMMVIHDTVLAGFHIPGILKSIFRAPMAYAGVLALLALQIGILFLIDASVDPRSTGILLTKLVHIVSSIFGIYAMLVTVRLLGLYARNHMRK